MNVTSLPHQLLRGNSAFFQEFLVGGKTEKKAESKILAVEVWRTRENKERFTFIKL